MRTRKNLYLFKVRKGLFMEDNEVKEYKKNNYIQKIITFAFMFCVFFAMIITIVMVSMMSNVINDGNSPVTFLIHLEIVSCCIMMILFILYLFCERRNRDSFNNKIATISIEELDGLMKTIESQEQKINKHWRVIEQLNKDSKKSDE